MKYNLFDLSAEDLILMGDALDARPHGVVSGLVKRVQAQISAQEVAAHDAAVADRAATDEATRAALRADIEKELAANIPPAVAPRRRRKGA